MTDSDIKLVLLFPMGLALVFMLWVLWKLEKQIRRGKSRPEPIAPRLTEFDHPASSGKARALHSLDIAVAPQHQQNVQSLRPPRIASR